VPPVKKKKKSRKPASKAAPAGLPDQLRTGMPAQDSVRKVVDFVSPQGVPFKILKTTEMDAYDEAPKKKRRRKSPR
jgi:hypothetical protein